MFRTVPRIAARWCGLLLLGVAAGCGSEPYSLAPVAGRVTLDGQPLREAQVRFQPAATGSEDALVGPGSYGRTDADGRFTLRTIDDDRAGAVVGPHRVFITAAQADPNDDPAAPGGVYPDPVPRHYQDGSLHFDVPASGTSTAHFDLSSK